MPFQAPFSSGVRAFNYDQQELASITGEGTEPTGALYNVGKFLSRPLYAVTSLLSGEPGDALENVLQMALDFPTGGFINRSFSLANLFTESGDITTKDERPEVSDVFRSWGMGRSEGLEKAAIDILGGMLLDPLTYLTLGTSAIAKGSLTSMGRLAAAEKVASQLSKSPIGAEMLEAALAGVKGQRGSMEIGAASQRFSQAKAVERVMGEAASGAIGASPASRAQLLDKLRRTNMYDEAAGEAGFFFTRAADQAGELNRGIVALENAGAIAKHGKLRFHGPFGFGPGVDLVDWRWGNVGRATLPALAYKALYKFDATKPVAEMVGHAATEGWDILRKTFFDKAWSRHATEALQHDTRTGAYKRVRGDLEARSLVKKVWRLIPESAARQTIGREWDRVGERMRQYRADSTKFAEDYRGTMEAGWVPPRSPNPATGEPWTRQEHMRAAMAGENPPAIQPRQEISAVTDAVWPTGPLNAKVARELLEEDALHAIQVKHPSLGIDQVREALGAYDKSMKKIPKELERLGVWKDSRGMDFYVPHQAHHLLGELMPAAQGPGGDVIRRGLTDVFTKRREMNTDEFIAALKGVAEDGGVILDDVVDWDIQALHLKRLEAHNKTVFRFRLMQQAEKHHGLKTNPNVSTYLAAQFGDIGMRSNTLMRVIGGGLLPVRNTSVIKEGMPLQELENVAKKMGWVLRVETSKRGRKTPKMFYRWKGLNHFFKPALTSNPQNVGFHFRNAFSAVVMGLFDPDIGLAGWRAMRDTMMDAPVIQRLTGKDPSEVGTLLRAMRGDDQMMASLAGKKIGNYSAQEVVGHLRSFIGRRVSSADLMDSIRADVAGLERATKNRAIRKLEDVFTEAGAAPRRFGGRRLAGLPDTLPVPVPIRAVAPEQGLWDAWVALGEKVGNHVEGTFRANAYITLIKKGVNPTEAMQRVEKAFVKYDVNSKAERVLRDLFPFARFMLGSSAWLGQMASRPARMLTPMARMQGSLQDDQMLPESVRGGVGIPLWRDHDGNMQYITSLGLPQEAAFGILDASTSFEGLRRSGLGALHPLIKAPLEQATNRNFFFGGEAGAYRRKPGFLPGGTPLLTEKITRPGGKVTYESPGWLRDAVGFTPASRIWATLGSLTDDRKSLADKLIRNVTGVRTVTVDQRRATAGVLEKWLESRVRSGQVGKINAFFSRFDKGETPEEIKTVLKSLSAFRSEKRRERKRKQR